MFFYWIKKPPINIKNELNLWKKYSIIWKYDKENTINLEKHLAYSFDGEPSGSTTAIWCSKLFLWDINGTLLFSNAFLCENINRVITWFTSSFYKRSTIAIWVTKGCKFDGRNLFSIAWKLNNIFLVDVSTYTSHSSSLETDKRWVSSHLLKQN